MLYVKLDDMDEPIEPPISLAEMKKKIGEERGIIFSDNTDFTIFKYGNVEIQFAEGHDPKDLNNHKFGKYAVLGIPIKKGSEYFRTIELIQASNSEIAILSNQMKNCRKKVFEECLDMISPMRWDEFTNVEKENILSFRQWFLDMPLKQNFPWIEFPALPECLSNFRSNYSNICNELPWKSVYQRKQ